MYGYLAGATDNPPVNYMKVCDPGRSEEVNAPQFFGFLLQDHGWGGNYDRFGRGGLLEKIMTRSKVCPHFVLTAHDSPYDGYAKVEWAEPAGSRGRCLFFNVDMGCLTPKTEEEPTPVYVSKMSAEEFFDIHD